MPGNAIRVAINFIGSFSRPSSVSAFDEFGIGGVGCPVDTVDHSAEQAGLSRHADCGRQNQRCQGTRQPTDDGNETHHGRNDDLRTVDDETRPYERRADESSTSDDGAGARPVAKSTAATGARGAGDGQRGFPEPSNLGEAVKNWQQYPDQVYRPSPQWRP
jgi:hypothetical protein